ncbi:hypothetical protein O181_090454 [Austropuccinia psidii MF-1]|uniref:Uncharacterized protein n=1 Tax=Austropuccinia psidii MF-1 TaxID=1389203 RepID=A0A9Q3IVG6_9BASI|nr:hypothetical protein [Austropuccinia psidii MF-1]
MIFTLLLDPQDETPMLPLISALTAPYASAPRGLQSLCSHGAHKVCLQHHPQPSCLSRKYAEWPSLPTGPKGKLVSIFTMLWLGFKS